MDRLEQDLTRKRPHDTYAPTHGQEARSVSPLTREVELPERDPGDVVQEREPGPRFRLDAGHHQSRSRWLSRDENGLQSNPGSPPPRCLAVIASREARLLAAMVNWIAPTEEPTLGQLRSRHCLAITGGSSETDLVGMVRFQPNVAGTGRDYLLTCRDTTEDHLFARANLGSRIIERYSLTPGLDWWAGDLRGVRGCYRFRAFQRGEFRTEIRLQVPGSDQVLPALAAVAIGMQLNLAPGEIKDRLEDFSGVPRGFESRGSFRGATLVDDEAFGVGAVADVLHLAREVFGRRPIRAVYQPHAATATMGAMPAAAEFAEADHLILVDSAPFRQESTRLLAASLRSSGASVVFCASLDGAIRELDRCLEPGDVLITLGAGEVGTIADAFLRRLSRDRHG